jgi:pyruvate dehydrogenase phosphatase
MALDQDVIQKPLSVLHDRLQDLNASQILPSPSPALMHLATLDKSGACFSTVVIDTAKDKLYVANLGDCRAIAGWRNPESGQYRCDILTIDGDANAANEVEVEKQVK